jgi:hypothetical protein
MCIEEEKEIKIQSIIKHLFNDALMLQSLADIDRSCVDDIFALREEMVDKMLKNIEELEEAVNEFIKSVSKTKQCNEGSDHCI